MMLMNMAATKTTPTAIFWLMRAPTAFHKGHARAVNSGRALLAAALNHTWAWYDTQVSRSLQVINYSLVAGAVLVTAYVSAVNGKHYPLAAVVAVAGTGVTLVTSLMVFRQMLEVSSAEPVLARLQDRVVGTSLARTNRTEH